MTDLDIPYQAVSLETLKLLYAALSMASEQLYHTCSGKICDDCDSYELHHFINRERGYIQAEIWKKKGGEKK